MSKTKSALFFGHVNVGKSTTLGHLFKKLKGISDEDHEFSRLKELAIQNKKPRSEFAYLLDTSVEEQQTGNTHEINRETIEYSDGITYTFYDTPGHRQYIQHFVDAAYAGVTTGVLIVSAEPGDFKSSLISGVVEEYTIICRCVGIKNLVVMINKMDKIDWSMDYKNVQKAVFDIVTTIGYKDPQFIVCSGYGGQGLIERTEKYPDIPCLLEVLQMDDTDADVGKSKPKAPRTKVTKCLVVFQLFRKSFITTGWKGVCHYVADGASVTNAALVDIVVDAIWDLSGKQRILCLQEGKARLALTLASPVSLYDKGRLLIRDGDKTVGGGIVVFKPS